MLKHYPFRYWFVVAAALGAASASVWGASADNISAQQRYKQESAYCMSGQSHQSRATCLREARNALNDAKRGRLDNAQQSAFHRNALARCDVLPVEDRADCAARVEGRGVVSGSVEGGGIYKETATVEIGTPADATPIGGPSEASQQQPGP